MRVLSLLLMMSLVLFSLSSSKEDSKIDLKSLEGEWEGTGEFVVPATNMTMSVEGRASFRYDSTQGYLRTALVGEKYFFAYSDSGHLVYNDKTDSVSWEVWDNFGKHAKYFGKAENNTIKGTRKRGNDIYSVLIELMSGDVIDFRLIVTGPDGATSDKAKFNLKRVKD